MEDFKIFNFDKQIKEKSKDEFIKYASLFNNCITHLHGNDYIMIFRINYSGVPTHLTDPDSILHPWNYWDREDKMTKLDVLLDAINTEVMQTTKQKVFLGSGIALMNYNAERSEFDVSEVRLLTPEYGYHDVRVYHEPSTNKIRITYTLKFAEPMEVQSKIPVINKNDKLTPLNFFYNADLMADLEKIQKDATLTTKISTMLGYFDYTYTNKFNADQMDDMLAHINTEIASYQGAPQTRKFLNQYMSDYVERNWIPTHPDMIFAPESYISNINGTMLIFTPPDMTTVATYSMTPNEDTEEPRLNNNVYYKSIDSIKRINVSLNNKRRNNFYNFIKKYDNMINVSLSTPIIRFGADRFLMCGHFKFDYQQFLSDDFFLSEIKKYINENTRIQNNYIYCTIFIELNRYCNVVRFSDPCIFSGNNVYTPYFNYRISMNDPVKGSEYFLNSIDSNPYLLTFPMGLTAIHGTDMICVSYGEGDCRPKAVMMPSSAIEDMLKYTPDTDIYTINSELKIRVLEIVQTTPTEDICKYIKCPEDIHLIADKYLFRHSTNLIALRGKSRENSLNEKAKKQSSKVVKSVMQKLRKKSVKIQKHKPFTGEFRIKPIKKVKASRFRQTIKHRILGETKSDII